MLKRFSLPIIIFLVVSIINANEFTVAPGDDITIAFRASGISSYAQTQVSDNGYLPIVLNQYEESSVLVNQVEYLTSIKVIGFTVQELEDSVKSAIKSIYKDADVTVMILSKRYAVNIIGDPEKEVISQKYIEGSSAWDYISRTEGMAEYGFITEVIVIKTNGEKEVLKDEDIFTYIPKYGETIFIPKQYVFVEGGVTSAGGYPYVRNKTTMYYVGLSGGAKSRDVNIGKGYVVKAENNEKIPISKNPIIDINDRIVVPEPKLSLYEIISLVITSAAFIVPLFLP